MIAYRHRWLQWICAVVVFGLNGGWTYAAAPVTTTVYPTGSFPLDVQNVQAAIDRGGTVILKATNAAGQLTAFDFGPPDPVTGTGVNLTTDVSILGERVGPYATTIEGGYIPILGFVPVKTTIQGIDFEGPLDSPIVLVSSTGADIIGNRIRGIVPVPLFFGFTEAEGIFVSGFDDPQHAITGRIRIADNIIEMSDGDFANGMQFDEVSADIEVSGNNVQFLQSNGVVQTIGILVFRSHGKANVVNNLVTMGPGDPDAFPSGIFVGGHAEARYMISSNTVITNHPNADGIDVLGFSFSGPTQHAVIEGNHVVTHSSISTAGGIAFVGAVKNSLTAANRIEGTSGNAIQVVGFDSTLTAESNRAVGNDIAQLSASDGDVFFGPDSINNLFAGHCNTYVDLGIGNRILCGNAIGSAGSAAPIANRLLPMIDTLGDDLRRARLDSMRSRLGR
jgi:hypothetical protein